MYPFLECHLVWGLVLISSDKESHLTFYYKLGLCYDGIGYSGWQIQPDQTTLQGLLNQALEKICHTTNIRSLACGRTDAGVHAFEQIVRVEIPLNITPESLKMALHSHLPPSFLVTFVERSSATFHPLGAVKLKTYRYYFTCEKRQHPFFVGHLTNFPFPLDIEKMKDAANIFVGTHDFVHYHSLGSDPVDTVRKIKKSELFKSMDFNLGPCDFPVFCYEVTGNGFLKQMVRRIVGALSYVGRSKVTLKDLESTLHLNGPSKISYVAPPHGLYLYSVEHDASSSSGMTESLE